MSRAFPALISNALISNFEIKFVLMRETNSHVGYDISPLSRAKLKILTTRLTACG